MMVVTRYKITCDQWKSSYIEVEYINTFINNVAYQGDEFDVTFWAISPDLIELIDDGSIEQPEIICCMDHEDDDYVFKIKRLKVSTTHQKIVTWCAFYAATFPDKYTVSKSDPGKMKGIDFELEYIKYFFKCTEWWAANKTIGTYCGQINNIKMGYRKGHNNPQGHPMGYNRDHERKLDSKGLMSYRKHLRDNCGLKPKKDGAGNTVDWVPKDLPGE